MAVDILDQCINMFGMPLSPSYKKRIRRFLANPTTDTWDDIQGIIIRPSPGLGVSIWEAVLEIDPTFPRRGRATDMDGHIIEDWKRIPTPLQVLQAIKRAIA